MAVQCKYERLRGRTAIFYQLAVPAVWRLKQEITRRKVKVYAVSGGLGPWGHGYE